MFYLPLRLDFLVHILCSSGREDKDGERRWQTLRQMKWESTWKRVKEHGRGAKRELAADAVNTTVTFLFFQLYLQKRAFQENRRAKWGLMIPLASKNKLLVTSWIRQKFHKVNEFLYKEANFQEALSSVLFAKFPCSVPCSLFRKNSEKLDIKITRLYFSKKLPWAQKGKIERKENKSKAIIMLEGLNFLKIEWWKPNIGFPFLANSRVLSLNSRKPNFHELDLVQCNLYLQESHNIYYLWYLFKFGNVSMFTDVPCCFHAVTMLFFSVYRDGIFFKPDVPSRSTLIH